MSAISGKKSSWKTTIAASMTSYIDAGSIVAGAAGLSLWKEFLHMNDWQIGLLGALSANAISAAIGALIGGYLCDKFGRKLVYKYDLLFYMLGMLIIIFSSNFPMLLAGYIIVGLSVGADVPTSWTVLAESAPAENRAKHCGSAQIAWSLGPVVALVLSVVLGPMGLLGNRIVFGHLIVVAFITWSLRRGENELDSWKAQKEKEEELVAKGKIKKSSPKDLLQPVNLKTMLFLVGVYLFWNLAAGTMGFFMPLIYQTVGGVSDTTANLLQAGLFGFTAIGTYFVFMRLGDKVSRKGIYATSSIMAVLAWSIFMLPQSSMRPSMLLIFVVGYGLSCGFGQQAFYQLWSSELFPARYRASAAGVMFCAVRATLGLWSVLVPTIMTQFGFQLAAACMVGFLIISAIVGITFAPNTSGKTLEEIEEERYGDEGFNEFCNE